MSLRFSGPLTHHLQSRACTIHLTLRSKHRTFSMNATRTTRSREPRKYTWQQLQWGEPQGIDTYKLFDHLNENRTSLFEMSCLSSNPARRLVLPVNIFGISPWCLSQSLNIHDGCHQVPQCPHRRFLPWLGGSNPCSTDAPPTSRNTSTV